MGRELAILVVLFDRYIYRTFNQARPLHEAVWPLRDPLQIEIE